MSLKQWFEKAFGPVVYTGTDQDGFRHYQYMPEVDLPPKPRLVPREAPTRDEFDAWRDEPVTQFVMGALARNAEECRESWMQLSWGGGVADQRTLDALRERSDALLGFTADYEAFCATLEVEPEGSNDAA